MVNDVGKLIMLLVVLVFGCVLTTLVWMQDHMVSPYGTGLIATVLGYVAGNGVLAARGEAPSPVIVPTNAKLTSKLVSEAIAEDRELHTDPDLTVAFPDIEQDHT